MKSGLKNSLPFTLLMTLALTSCQEGGELVEEETPPSETPPAVTPPSTAPPSPLTPVDSAGFSLKITSDQYLFRLHEGTSVSSTAACSVSSTSSNKNITCVMDVQELDVYFHGADIEYNVPSNLCSYVNVSMPYYYNFEPGYGPSAISYDVNSAGAVVNVLPVGAFADGKPVCAYDYSGSEGPNCCLGSYTLSVRTWDPTLNGGAGAYGAPRVSTAEWGGQPGNCLGGPALDLEQKNRAGYPMSKLYFVEGVGRRDKIAVPHPIEKQFGSNLYVANFFNTADHGGNIPVAFRVPANAPSVPATQPYYQWTCYDRAQEIQARIRLMIREWNLTSEFLAIGDPDVGTSPETGYGTPQNDHWDWKDLGSLYPQER